MQKGTEVQLTGERGDSIPCIGSSEREREGAIRITHLLKRTDKRSQGENARHRRTADREMGCAFQRSPEPPGT